MVIVTFKDPAVSGKEGNSDVENINNAVAPLTPLGLPPSHPTGVHQELLCATLLLDSWSGRLRPGREDYEDDNDHGDNGAEDNNIASLVITMPVPPGNP